MKREDSSAYTPPKELYLTVWETQGTDYVPKSAVENDVVAEWLFAKTKVRVDTMYGNGGGQWDVKLNNLLNSDDLPHIIHCGAGQGPTHFAKLDELGKVWELTPEMIQQYAPEVWRRTPEKYWEKIKVNGKIFGIPYISPIDATSQPEASEEALAFMQDCYLNNPSSVTYSSGQYLWIRDDILTRFYPDAKTYEELLALVKEKNARIGDALLDIPIFTTEEFVQLFYNIRDLQLTENGKTVYPFGYVGGDNWTALTWFGSDMYGYKGHAYSGTWNNATEQIEIPLTGALVKQAAKTQNQMIFDKVIDPESLTHTIEQYREKVLNGEYAVAPLAYIGSPNNINRALEQAGKPYRYRPFLTQVPAQKGYEYGRESSDWSRSLCFLKTLSYDEVCQVLNWINTQYTDEYEQICYWGPEEAGLYEIQEDGKRVFKDERFNRYFIEEDDTALQRSECRGLGGEGLPLSVTPCGYSHWDPVVVHRRYNFENVPTRAFQFTDDSPYVKNILTYPPCQIWAAEFSGIPEVVTFWTEREQWESRFKFALASEPKDFEHQWEQAIEDLNRIVNVSEMERKMSEVAKPLADKIKEEER